MDNLNKLLNTHSLDRIYIDSTLLREIRIYKCWLTKFTVAQFSCNQQCTMQQGLTFEEKKLSWNVQLWKLISLSIFIQLMIFFGGGSLSTPKIGKRKQEFTNINLRGFKTQKMCRGCFSRIKRVSKFSFLYMLWYLLS